MAENVSLLSSLTNFQDSVHPSGRAPSTNPRLDGCISRASVPRAKRRAAPPRDASPSISSHLRTYLPCQPKQQNHTTPPRSASTPQPLDSATTPPSEKVNTAIQAPPRTHQPPKPNKTLRANERASERQHQRRKEKAREDKNNKNGLPTNPTHPRRAPPSLPEQSRPHDGESAGAARRDGGYRRWGQCGCDFEQGVFLFFPSTSHILEGGGKRSMEFSALTDMLRNTGCSFGGWSRRRGHW